MEIVIDRSLPLTITEQIKGKITYDVMCGNLMPGTPLPSVRELAGDLNVAPMTITRVYRELASDGLVDTKQGVGTFVADVTGVDREKAIQYDKNLQQLAATFLQQAMALGYDAQVACRAVRIQLQCQDAELSGPRLVLVGNFERATGAYAREVEAILHDINVRVESVVMSHLLVNLEEILPKLRDASLVIAVPSRLHEVREILQPYSIDVVAVGFRVSNEVRRKVGAIPPNWKVGVIATYPEFLYSLLDGVMSFGLLETRPLSAYLEQEEMIKDLVQRVDLVIYASGSERILKWLPKGVHTLEFRHVPDPDSVNRLRPLLRDQMPVGIG